MACFDGNFTGANGLIAIGGCLGEDFDFDGVPYRLVWPGTLRDVRPDRAIHPRPVEFTSPQFKDDDGRKHNYSRVAFEANLPRIESNTNPPCQRHVSKNQVILEDFRRVLSYNPCTVRSDD